MHNFFADLFRARKPIPQQEYVPQVPPNSFFCGRCVDFAVVGVEARQPVWQTTPDTDTSTSRPFKA